MIDTAIVGLPLASRETRVSARQMLAYAAGIGDTSPAVFDDAAPGFMAHPALCVALEWPVVSDPATTATLVPDAADRMRARSLHEAIIAIEASVGNSVMTVESVPAAIGVFVAAAGDPHDTVSAGASIGNDSDTIAAMAGALAGALRGIAAVPADLAATVRGANHEDIDALAAGLAGLARGAAH